VWAVPDGGAGGGQDCRGHGGESAGIESGHGIPNFLVLSGGKTVVQQAGMVDHQQMEQWLRSAAE